MKKQLAFTIIIGLLVIFSCKEYDEIVIEDVPLSSAKNGIYTGEYNTTLVKAKVTVRVQDGNIDKIEILKHQCGQGREAESITTTVVEKQTLKVDAISGATYSSKVILKAIENALQKSIAND